METGKLDPFVGETFGGDALTAHQSKEASL